MSEPSIGTQIGFSLSAPSQSSTGKDDVPGVISAAAAYAIWGVMPLYWRLLTRVQPYELMIHRALWCAVFTAFAVAVRGHLPRMARAVRLPGIAATLALTGVLITFNWTVFIYCVETNQLVEASLGYYITPLISFVLGFLLFGEHLSRLRAFALVLAGAAVIAQVIAVGHFPWLALALSLSFGFYGYFRKRVPIDALDGLVVETGLLFPVTLGLAVWWAMRGGAFPSSDLGQDGLLIGAGPLTAIPLVLFGLGVRRIRLTTLGFLQYLSPTITLLIATFGLGERFTRTDLMSFACVWAALIVVAVETQTLSPAGDRAIKAPQN